MVLGCGHHMYMYMWSCSHHATGVQRSPFEHLRGACACALGAYCLRPAHGDLVYPCTQQMYSLGRWHGPQGAEKPIS